MFLYDEGPTLETLDFTIRFGSTPTYSYFNLYLYTAIYNLLIFGNNGMTSLYCAIAYISLPLAKHLMYISYFIK